MNKSSVIKDGDIYIITITPSKLLMFFGYKEVVERCKYLTDGTKFLRYHNVKPMINSKGIQLAPFSIESCAVMQFEEQQINLVRSF